VIQLGSGPKCTVYKIYKYFIDSAHIYKIYKYFIYVKYKIFLLKYNLNNIMQIQQFI